MYDAIVVGARVAGAPTAMLLARSGYRVLLVDRSFFPSDIMSTHFIHPWGMAALNRWGLLEDVTATGCPPIPATLFMFGSITSIIPAQAAGSVKTAYCPRRNVLDDRLVRAAVQAGAELRERFVVQELLFEGARVVGVRGRSRDGKAVDERASVVIGADGMHSLVARGVSAPRYDERGAHTVGYYSYFSGVPLPTGSEIIFLGGRTIFAFATHDDLTCIAVTWPVADFKSVRADIEGAFFQTLADAQGFAARVLSGKREERWTGSRDTDNFFRKPFGPGWALVGDAGYHKDPVTGTGISDAFRDAELLVRSLDAGLGGREPLDQALQSYQHHRDAAAAPWYDMTCRLASYQGPPEGIAQIFAESRTRRQAAVTASTST